MKHKTEPIYSDLQKAAVQAEIDTLTDQIKPDNIITIMNQIGALTIKLKQMRNEIDFTMNNRHDWGVRVINY